MLLLNVLIKSVQIYYNLRNAPRFVHYFFFSLNSFYICERKQMILIKKLVILFTYFYIIGPLR